MARLDTILAVVFGAISVLTLALAVYCFQRALRVSNQKDGDLKMFFWASGTLVGLTISGVSAAYILLPIFLHYFNTP